MNRLDGKTHAQRIAGSTLFESGVVFTVREMQLEIGGGQNALKYACQEMCSRGEMSKRGDWHYQKREPHWINQGRLAGENCVRCPQ